MSQLKLAIYGSTGSIGTQALEVISNYRSEFKLVLLTGFKNTDLIIKQAEEFEPNYISTPDQESYERLLNESGLKSRVIDWKEATGLIQSDEIETVLNALVGASGLKISVATLLSRKKLLLANKESLVIGGEFINRYIPEWRNYCSPFDSEHSAIFQCLLGESEKTVKQIILTASGGPFKNLSKDELLFKVSRQYVHQVIVRACKKAGLDRERAHAHTFRHSFAVNCIMKQIPPAVVQRVLGHADPTSTALYMNILASDLKMFFGNIRKW